MNKQTKAIPKFATEAKSVRTGKSMTPPTTLTGRKPRRLRCPT